MIHLIVRYAPWFWLAVCVLFLAVEAATFSLTTIWFACGAFFVIFVALFGVPLAWQVFAFAVVSLVLLAVTRRFVVKLLAQKKQPMNVESLIGRKVLVTGAITPVQKGSVKVNGIVWSARSEDGSELPLDSVCEITAIEGATAVVKKVPLHGNV